MLWVADITYIPTWAGFLYLAVVLDAFSRRIVGWSMTTTLHTQVVLDALDMALGHYGSGEEDDKNVNDINDNTCAHSPISIVEFQMAITKKENELAAVGISIDAGCKPCTDYHMKAVREAGASDEDIRRAVDDAVELRNAATSIMRNYGRSHLGEAEHEVAAAIPRDRVAELIGLGAAFAVNCVPSLERYSRHAELVGVTKAEVLEIVKSPS